MLRPGRKANILTVDQLHFLLIIRILRVNPNDRSNPAEILDEFKVSSLPLRFSSYSKFENILV